MMQGRIVVVRVSVVVVVLVLVVAGLVRNLSASCKNKCVVHEGQNASQVKAQSDRKINKYEAQISQMQQQQQMLALELREGQENEEARKTEMQKKHVQLQKEVICPPGSLLAVLPCALCSPLTQLFIVHVFGCFLYSPVAVLLRKCHKPYARVLYKCGTACHGYTRCGLGVVCLASWHLTSPCGISCKIENFQLRVRDMETENARQKNVIERKTEEVEHARKVVLSYDSCRPCPPAPALTRLLPMYIRSFLMPSAQPSSCMLPTPGCAPLH